MRGIGLAIAFALMAAILWLGQSPGVTRLIGVESIDADPGSPEHSTWLFAIGFMLLASFFSGGLARAIRLPKITGYLAIGALIGPSALALVDAPMIDNISIVKGLAVSLIALNAGGELNLGWVRQRLREVTIIFAWEAMAVIVAVGVGVYLLRDGLGTIPLEQQGVLVSVVILVAIVAVVNSPMVAIALINDTRSEGPLSRMVIVVSVFKDIFLVIGFTVALEVCRTLTSDDALSAGAFAELVFLKVLGSIVFGAAIGWLLALYVRRVGREMPMVVIVVCFFIALVGAQLHFKPLLVALATGCFIENFAKDAGHKVIEGIRRTSLPVYCLFFALAGVELHLEELRQLGPVVLTLCLVRMTAIVSGCAIGTRLARSEPIVQRFVWAGLISQAGLSLAFASIIAEAYEWGPSVATLLIAMIVVHEMIGPIIFNWTLHRSGEAGRAGANRASDGAEGTRPLAAPGSPS